MKKDVILAGVGGQGILSIAAVIGLAATETGLHLKQAEVHGMSQRGGAVQSHLRISDRRIASDLIPEGSCDMILSVEPMEGLRYLPFLTLDGWLVSARKPIRNIEDYPDEEALFSAIAELENHLLIDATEIAGKLGSQRVSNMVMLGAAFPKLGMDQERLESAIRTLFSRKGEEVVQLNISALAAGKEAADGP